MPLRAHCKRAAPDAGCAALQILSCLSFPVTYDGLFVVDRVEDALE